MGHLVGEHGAPYINGEHEVPVLDGYIARIGEAVNGGGDAPSTSRPPSRATAAPECLLDTACIGDVHVHVGGAA